MWYLSHFVSFFKESHDKIDPHMSEAKKKKRGGVTVGKWSIPDCFGTFPQQEHLCGVSLRDISPPEKAPSWRLNGAGERQGRKSLDGTELCFYPMHRATDG